MKTNKFMLFAAKRMPWVFEQCYGYTQRHRQIVRLAKRTLRLIEPKLDEAFGWSIDRDEYDSLLALKIWILKTIDHYDERNVQAD